MRPYFYILFLTSGALALSGCQSTIDRLNRTGVQPPLTKVENPQTDPEYKPLSWPLPDPETASIRTANSLWQPGARAFFRDQRASRVGDILRVNIDINDTAKIDSKTDNSRNTSDDVGPPVAMGYEKYLGKITPWATGNPMVALDSNRNISSTGKVDRKDSVTTQVAALVTQVLPNGNLVIRGSQEILVNFEVREVAVEGVIRPQDINSDNTIELAQIAEARIVYSGRGQISDMQQARWGSQLVEALFPF
ncbi:MAG: flagellar basal body L-ring protein FlgH [Alphaproteobacteria bacterium]